MFKIIVRAALALLLLVAVLAAGAFGYRAWRQHENAVALAIHSPNGIEEASFVRIGGIDQWIQIRGEDRRNPVLLILAGGPGNTLVPLTPVFRSWEKAFTIVQWDQRGCGKTFGRNGAANSGSMTIDRFARDGIEVAQYLEQHLHKSKIVIVGHSWGSILGVVMAKRRPDLFAAYVGTGQVVAKEAKEERLYRELMQKERAAGDTKAIATLQRIGPPPYRSEADLEEERDLSLHFDVASERDLESRMTPVVLFAPEFSLFDIRNMMAGQAFTGEAMYRETLSYDTRKLGARFALPFFVFQGDSDRVTPADEARAYFDSVQAPAKAYVDLHNGGHSAMLTMPDDFLAALLADVRPIAMSGGKAVAPPTQP